MGLLVRIKPEDAVIGMYVQGFDGTWLSHPFWRSRFIVTSNDELARIRSGGVDIFIDPAKGAAVPERRRAQRDDRVAASVGAAAPTRWTPPTPVSLSRSAQPLRRGVAPPAFGKADRTRAVALAERSTSVVKGLFEDCRLGRSVPAPQILAVVDDIASTLEQNSAAFSSVIRLRTKDDATYTHSVAVCALMITLARETGASAETVQALGTAGLLHDIGKVSIDAAILRKETALTDLETAEIRRHPELGHALLLAETGIPPVALDTCLHHHERLDGSGYPFGLRDESISTAARMAAICDVYNAMISSRPYRKGMTPHAAIAQMDAATGHFDRTLLFKFMRSIGVFPPGKLVRLRSNRLAVVLPAFREDCLPLVRAFYDTIGSQFIGYDDTVLSDSLNDDQAISQEEPEAWFSSDWGAMSARIMAGKGLSTVEGD